MKVIKEFALGLLFAVLSPLILAAVVLLGVFWVFNFLVQFIIMAVNFFRGKKLFPTMPEDEEAAQIIQASMDRARGIPQTETPAPAPQPQQVYVQQNIYQQVPQNPWGTPQPPQNPYISQPNPTPFQPSPQNLPPQQPLGVTPPQDPYAAIPEEKPALAQFPPYEGEEGGEHE